MNNLQKMFYISSPNILYNVLPEYSSQSEATNGKDDVKMVGNPQYYGITTGIIDLVQWGVDEIYVTFDCGYPRVLKAFDFTGRFIPGQQPMARPQSFKGSADNIVLSESIPFDNTHTDIDIYSYWTGNKITNNIPYRYYKMNFAFNDSGNYSTIAGGFLKLYFETNH